VTTNIEKVIFDTDIGSDIDDAVALAYLLAEPRCELVGVTTVSGQPEVRAMLASALCKAASAEVPIRIGADNRLDGPTRQPKVPQSSVLSDWDHDSVFENQDAVDFIADTVRTSPGEITLLAVGPMTNIGKLFSEHPDVPPLLKSLRVMCGRFTDAEDLPSSEWNAHCDPAAASILYSTQAPGHTSLGLDVTYRVAMNSSEVAERFTHPLLKPVYEMSKVWFEEREVLRFHDPLAAVTIFDDSICAYEQGTAVVTRSDDRSDGTIDWVSNENGPHRIGVTVDADRFFDSYFGVFK
jgi:inosine-uridine nucleoside N-ribohydrolase